MHTSIIRYSFLIAFIAFFAPSSSAQIITTVVGAGSFGGSRGDGGPAIAATLLSPVGLTFDASGNLFISEALGNIVRKVNSDNIITTVAGSGGAFNIVNAAPATTAGFDHPAGIAVDASGNLYVGSTLQWMIFKVTPSGTIYFFSGDDTCGYTGDNGPCTNARIGQPQGLTIDGAGNIYFTDFVHNVIRKISAAGTISTYAGTSIAGYTGDGGPATAADIDGVEGIAADKNGNIYFSDYDNGVIRKINASGIISTIAGTGTLGFSGDGGPATMAQINPGNGGIAVDDSGNVYFADAGNFRIRKIGTTGIISTIAGNGTITFGGDECMATATGMWPTGLALDASGNLFYADLINNRVCKISNTSLGVTKADISNHLITDIYPNPCKGSFTISSNTDRPLNISVIDIAGKELRKFIVQPHVKTNITLDLPEGIYVVAGNDGVNSSYTKLVIAQ